MNREDIVRMAQETGVTAERVRDLVNFATLVERHVRATISEEAKAQLQELRNNFDVESAELRLHKWAKEKQ
jgi:hypothetical protein